MRVTYSLLILLVMFMMVSCDKEEIVLSNETQEETTSFQYFSFDKENGRLQFSSLLELQDFSALVRKSKAPEDKIVELIKPVVDYGGYYPMYPFYKWEKYEESQLLKYTQRMASVQSFMNEVLDQDVNSKATNDIEFDQYIFDDVMLNLINLNGEVGIGNEIYHYLPYGLFITSTEKGLAVGCSVY